MHLNLPTFASVAQLVEQGPFKPLVVGSSPSGGTIPNNGELSVKCQNFTRNI